MRRKRVPSPLCWGELNKSENEEEIPAISFDITGQKTIDGPAHRAAYSSVFLPLLSIFRPQMQHLAAHNLGVLH